CIVVDYGLPDVSGSEVLNQVNECKGPLTPVIIYSARDLNEDELAWIDENSSVIVTKQSDAIERLLEEVVILLHFPHSQLSIQKRRIIENIRNKEDMLSGKNVLIVDDDVRNLFALTTVFERFNINVITAESGHEAIQIL